MRNALAFMTVPVAVLALAACGSSSSSSSSKAAAPASSSSSTTAAASSSSAASSGGQSLAIAANPSGQLAYTKKTLSAKAGKMTITMTNMSPVMHNFTVQEGTAGKILGATPTFNGGSRSLTLDLKPGTYTYFCSVPGHRQAGMVGTLTVK